MINYNQFLQGIYGNHLERVEKLNTLYDIYEGKQKWDLPSGLDYKPTQIITNLIKKLIDTKARFMFGMEPFYDVKQTLPDEPNEQGLTPKADEAQEKEDMLHKILRDNKFHSKLIKAFKDSCIGGQVAIKLWGRVDKGLKLIFTPAQEFVAIYDEDDIDTLRKVIFIYGLNDATLSKDQRIKKQEWELVEYENGSSRCILNEGVYDGQGELIEVIEDNRDTELDFIPVVVITNGGLTGETEGKSDVEQLWSNQDAYNRLTSDDIDALRFNLFPQYVATDADGQSLDSMKIAPGSLIDLQSDSSQLAGGKQAKLETLETKFAYADKFKDTISRLQNNMHDLIEVPNVSLDQLKGLMTSGKSMRALYWGLIAACEEAATEWEPALEQMIDYLFRIIQQYNLYGMASVAAYDTALEITRTYPIQEDTDTQKKIDMEEVVTEVRSRKSYMNKWGEYESLENEMEQIQREMSIFSTDTDLTMEAQANYVGTGEDINDGQDKEEIDEV